MTIPIQNELRIFFEAINNDTTGFYIIENYKDHINSLNYILQLSDSDISTFYNNHKIYINIKEIHIKQIKKYAVETNDDRPLIFKLAYGFWLYSHTSHLV